MKTRKQKTPESKRARHRPAGSRTARRRAAARRDEAAPGTSAQSRAHDDGALTLAAECTVADAEALKSELTRRLEESAPVTVDVSALQRIDTAALQLIAAFVRDRRTAGRTVEWRGRPSALEAAAGLLGLNDMLELAGEVGR